MEQLLKERRDDVAPEQGRRTPVERFRDILRSKVCRKCIDGNGSGRCRLPADQQCSLELFLPAVVDTILAVKGNSLSDYTKAVRTNICAHCDEQTPGGECERRNQLECPLDRYLPLVIQVIEEFQFMPQPSTL